MWTCFSDLTEVSTSVFVSKKNEQNCDATDPWLHQHPNDVGHCRFHCLRSHHHTRVGSPVEPGRGAVRGHGPICRSDAPARRRPPQYCGMACDKFPSSFVACFIIALAVLDICFFPMPCLARLPLSPRLVSCVLLNCIRGRLR